MKEVTQATFGMSESGAETYINNLKAEVIDKAASEIETKVEDFCNKVDTYWHGNAKDDFEKKIKEDAEELSKKIKKLTDELEIAFNKTRDSLQKFDESFKTEGIKF